METIEDQGPNDSYLGKYYTRMTIGEYSRPGPFKSSEFKTKKVLYFPLPVDLRDNTSVGYNNQNLESVGDLINADTAGFGAAALRNAGPIFKGAVSELAAVVGMATTSFGGKYAGAANKIGSVATGAIGKVFSEDQITSAIQEYTGLAPNPNPSVMFTGPELRDFSHSWTFYPKNETESIKLQKIIRILKQSALPTNTFKNSAAILNYPNMIQLNFYPWDDSSKINGGAASAWGWTPNSILRYKKCVMKSVSVNYTPGGSPGFFEGTNGAVATTITITFMEIEYMLAGDWFEGTDTAAKTFAEGIGGVNGGAIEAIGSVTQTIPNLPGSGLRPDQIK